MGLRLILRNSPRLQNGKDPGIWRRWDLFWGFASYYQDFIEGFAGLAEPLQWLVVTTKQIKFEWGRAQEETFLGIKRAFTQTPILRYPRSVGCFILDTDASAFAISGVLSQVQDGVEVPLSFASNQLNKAQWHYCTTKRELMAIVMYTKKWKHFLVGSDFIIRTDHHSLRWYLILTRLKGWWGAG